MRSLLPRAAAWALATFIAARVLMASWRVVADISVFLLAALYLSFAIEPAVSFLHRRGARRGVAALAMLFSIVVGVIAMAASVGALLAAQLDQLRDRLPGLVAETVVMINERFDTDIDPVSVVGPDGPFEQLQVSLASGAVGAASGLLSGVAGFLVVLFVAFYLSAEQPKLIRGVCSLFPPDRQRSVRAVFETAVAKTAGYLSSRLVLGAVSAFAHSVFLTALGTPYAIPLGIWVGVVSQLVPVFGTYIAALAPLVVLSSYAGAGPIVAAVAFMVFYQQVENNLFAPRLTRQAVDIHPVVALLSVIIGTQVAGFAGALVAVPLAATLTATIAAYVRFHDVDDHGEQSRPARAKRYRPSVSGEDKTPPASRPE